MTTIEYLSMSGPERAVFKTLDWFKALPGKVSRGFSKLPSRLARAGRKVVSPLTDAYDAARNGDWRTRLSFLIMGFGHLTRRQILRGCLYLLYEILFIVFMVLVGGPNLKSMGSLGQMAVTNINVGGFQIQFSYDDSLRILLYSVISIFLILVLAYLYFGQIKDSLRLQRSAYIGHYTSDKQTLKNVLDKSYHRTLLTIPMAGVVIFTIIPVVIMVLIAFTNYNSYHLTPGRLIDWVGFQNFATLFSAGMQGSSTLFIQKFGEVLLWTLIWAIFATFTNYFLGMIVAMIINAKGVRLKKVWRTILITTIAVPSFISLLLMSKMLDTNYGIINSWIETLGGNGVPWLTDGLIAKVTIIVVNMWIGIPYTMLMCTGLLMNIPADLYESARIDGASAFKTYMKITLPYMMFVTSPYLISNFVSNINNFNVIYLLSGGGPNFSYLGYEVVPQQLSGLGQTDLLITWIYKMCMTNSFKDYGTASVVGLMIFVVVAFLSLVVFNNTNSIKNEEDYQ